MTEIPQRLMAAIGVLNAVVDQRVLFHYYRSSE